MSNSFIYSVIECGSIHTSPSGVIEAKDRSSWGRSTSMIVDCFWIIRVTAGHVISLRFQSLQLWTTYEFTGDHSAYIEIYDGINKSSNLLAYFYGQPDNAVPDGIIRSTNNEMFIIQYTGLWDGWYGYSSNGFSASYWSHECQPFTYGPNCTQSCTCIQSKTQYCNSTTGQCVCKPGWTSSDCSVDIDECIENPLSCPDYSTCTNTAGSFQCTCKEGLTLTAGKCAASSGVNCITKKCSHVCVKLLQNGENFEQCYCPFGMYLEGNQCLACTNYTYGPDCNRTCGCVQNHSLACDPRTGECTCLSLWKGFNCSIEYDVCTKYSINQCQKYANCTDTSDRGYRCRCSQNNGYTESANTSCIPINCTYVLTNSTGLITSPLYPSNYMNNAFCSWTIRAKEDNIITVQFETNYIDDYNCLNDYMELYNGDSASATLIGRYCGSGVPKVIRTTGNKLYIIFKSDWKYNYGKFNGSYISHPCHTFTYGTDSCNNLCRCVKENTEFCDNVNGECICKPGWTLGDCSQDVNECLGTNNKVCPTNSDCINTRGSYTCQCHLGYILNTTNGLCDENHNCIHKKCSHVCYIVSPGNEKCVCPEGLVLDTVTQQTCVVPYYPFGQNTTDLLLNNSYTSYNSLFVSSSIYFNSGAPYGYNLQTSAYVLSNGAIGFGNSATSFVGNDIQVKVNNKKLNLLAPFMTNINPLKGEVYYNLYEKCAQELSVSGNPQQASFIKEIYTRAENNIKEYHHLDNFKVSSVLIVTWAEMQPLGANKKNIEQNTFQAVYISGFETEDGSAAETAYVIFLYQYGLMNWPYLPGRTVFIGTTGDFKNELQDLNTVLVSVLGNVPGNTGYKGVMSYKVGHVTGPQQSCKKYLCDHADLLTDPVYQYEKQELYKCPCTLERLGAQWQLFERRGSNLDIYCYAISMVAKQRLLKRNKRNKLCCYKWTKPANDDWREWLQSWIEATYLPQSSESGHVLLNDPWFLTFYYNNLYVDNYQGLENIRAHTLCCKDAKSADLCQQFYQIFPDMGCSNFVEFVPASALGDPHIKTLDGVTYTMNGWGEYILMEAPSDNFRLQARTGKAETLNGTLSKATVFIAFAAKESNDSSFQVELSPSKSSLIVFANDVDITNDFYKENGSDIIMSTTSINVIREYKNNKTLAIATFPCGVSITVYVAVKSLLIEVNVPKTMENKTRGLLGNFNGNKTDEFILPDGQLLPANLSERQIYQEFAKKWTVTSISSVFTYKPGETTDTYQHPDFTPMFRDEANPTQLAKAVEICGDANDACIFDYLATGDAAFAQVTKDTKEEMEIIIVYLENNPPTIEIANDSLDASGRWLVMEGVPSFLAIIANDKDNDSVTLELADNATGVSINQSGYVHIMPNLTNPILLRIRAKDSKGSYSQFVYIPITICPSCNGNGACNYESSISEEFENGWFQIKACHCLPSYTGKYCDSELDGCQLNPCFKGQTCTDLTALQQGNNSVGYQCGPCPTGYTEWMGTCADLDECNDTHTCQNQCTNTEGSYVCSCPDGYRLDKVDRHSCKDINECEERTSKCQHKCNNQNGNYTCSCYSGYTLDDNGLTCSLDEDKKNLCYKCQQVCQVTIGDQVDCNCRIGYEVDPKDSTNCKDIDECQYGTKPCSHNCVNTNGSYQCSCYAGYKLAVDQTSCDSCTSPYYGENCANICQCNNRGSCDSVRGCVCNKQWTGVNCEIDVNECDQPDTCPTGYLCENTIGSYKCICPSGYKLENGQCKDINECTDVRNITCDPSLEDCVNNIGSYSCQCKSGFARNKESICQDIDECLMTVNNCEQICDNKPGTYNCQCYPGFILADNRKNCLKVKEDCNVNNINCSYGCRIDSSNATVCFCPQGFNVNRLGQCEDINECNSENLNLCAYKDGCMNTNGSYTCTCPLGSKLDNNKRTCTNCTGGTWGVECSKSCSCGTGTDHCDPKTGCICKSGFTGTLCNQDVDECQDGSKRCAAKEKCVNLPGTAMCVCQDGYKNVSNTCQDFNECSSSSTNDCSQVCTNLEGSYTCSCYSGYFYNTSSKMCTDINECSLGIATCQQICINTEGSFRCSCPEGLHLLSDGTTCEASTPCVSLNCSSLCATINNTETCFCPKGSVLNLDGIHCDDIDLCKSSPCTFGCVEIKQNTSYECVCSSGQSLASDGITCADCVEGRWGLSCNNVCNCLTINTKHCNQVSGQCQCKAGWTGQLCDQDVDECQNLTLCPTHSHCRNTDGGFTCVCDDGYVNRNSTSVICEECDEGFFGSSCSQKCPCSVNTVSCNKTTGACYCKIGWEGAKCDSDIDECHLAANICNTTKHEICLNTQGSYQCLCNKGFMRTCSSCNCEDINECNDMISPCEQTCLNLEGSFNCTCREGFTISSTNTAHCSQVSQYNVSMTFNLDVTGKNVEDKTSRYHQSLKSDIETQVTLKLKEEKVSALHVNATNLRTGSLITDVIIQISAEVDSIFTTVLKTIVTQTFILDNTVVFITKLSVDGAIVNAPTCEAKKLMSPCLDTEECILENNTAICRQKVLTDASETDKTSLTLGLTIGIPLSVVCCLLVLVSMYCIKKTNANKVKDISRQSLQTPDFASATSDKSKLF
ncbi:mucin-like protein [Biomphalaria glabrata]|nr:mucin-like protein [Biomphalaria glabrata]